MKQHDLPGPYQRTQLANSRFEWMLEMPTDSGKNYVVVSTRFTQKRIRIESN